jgi:N-acetyl-anhydromuramyl-L-alanine amidase AmpD
MAAISRKYTGLAFTEYWVATGHYDTSRAGISMIVLHSSDSNRQGLINTFAGGTRMVSAHYAVDNDGSLLAFLEEYYTAYHAGNYAVNQKSIGIEHIDNGATVKLHTDLQYAKSIKLVADICKFYSIPCDATHVVPHSSIIATACPNGLDVNRIIAGAKVLLNPPMTDQQKLAQIKTWANDNSINDSDFRYKTKQI